MSRVNETRGLPVKLTDSEFKVRSSELATAAIAIAKKKDAIKDATADMKKQLKELETNHSKLVHVVDRGEEYRDVECSWSADYSRRMWILYRDDTGEEVATEAMSEKDIQTRLGFDARTITEPEVAKKDGEN